MDNSKHRQDPFSELPLPDMEESWRQMKKKLGDDKDRKPFLWLLRTCAGWGLLLLITGGGVWYAINKYSTNKNQSTYTATVKQTNPGKEAVGNNNEVVQNITGNSKKMSGPNESTTPEIKTNLPVTGISGAAQNNFPVNPYPAERISSGNEVKLSSDESIAAGKSPQREIMPAGDQSTIKGSDQISNKNKSQNLARTTNRRQNATVKMIVSASSARGKKHQAIPGNLVVEDRLAENTDDTISAAMKEMDVPDDRPVQHTVTVDTVVNQHSNVQTDSLDDTQSKPGNPGDRLAAKAADKNDKMKKNALVFSAGIGLQQQIPLAGQGSVPYNYYGRKNSLSDYLPSVYGRIEKGSKWFIEAEFRYGAAQKVKDFSYSRKTQLDDSAQVLSSTSYRLRKTYYHQLPVSFNYYVLPKLSVGAGMVYSRFQGAVSEKIITRTNLQTETKTVTTEVVNLKHFNDSFLYKTQLHLLVQAEYHWKRFIFGLRYTRDLQPYITFTTPEGGVRSQRNQALQAMIRFRLWRSKTF